jgi:two-component system response regulator
MQAPGAVVVRARKSVNPMTSNAVSHNEIEILLVEDDADDVELTLRAMRKNHLVNKVHVVRDGEEALDFLFCRGPFDSRHFENPPRVVFLDLKLPKVNGLEVLREIKGDKRTRAIPVVVMTSSREQRDVIEGYHLGVNSYIQKPIDFEQFQNVVNNLGYYWLVVNESPPPGAFGPQT